MEGYEVRPVGLKAAAAFIAQHHYAGGCSNTATYLHGLWKDGALCGVVWWIPPGSPNVARWTARQFEGDVCWKTQVLTLSRMALAPSVPKNGASWMLARSVRLIRADRRYRVAVTYADRRQGHDGGVYRASGWTYTGESAKEPSWLDPQGRQVARKAKKNRTKGEMLALGYTRLPPMGKARYIRAITKVKIKQEV